MYYHTAMYTEDSTCFEEVFTQLLAAAGVHTTGANTTTNSNTTQESSSSSSSSSWSQCTSTKLKRRATWQLYVCLTSTDRYAHTTISVHQEALVLAEYDTRCRCCAHDAEPSRDAFTNVPFYLAAVLAAVLRASQRSLFVPVYCCLHAGAAS
eukprot:21084-Heterococcus_DN1.PRE.1